MTKHEISKEEVESFLKGADAVFSNSGFKASIFLMGRAFQMSMLIFTVMIIVASLPLIFEIIPSFSNIYEITIFIIGGLYMLAFLRVIFKLIKNMQQMNQYIEYHSCNMQGKNWEWKYTLPYYLELRKTDGSNTELYQKRSHVPKSTNNVLIYRFGGWRRNFYCKANISATTDGRFSEVESQNITQQFHSILVQERFVLKRKLVDVFTWVEFLLILVTFAMEMLVVIDVGPPLQQIIVYIAVPAGVLLVPWLYCFLTFLFVDSQAIREVLLRVIITQNRILESRGLRWYLPSHFPMWIELWKDYRYYGYDTENEDDETGARHNADQIVAPLIAL